MCDGCMCGADPGIIPGPGRVAVFLARRWRELAGAGAAVAVVVFVAAHALIVGLAGGAFLAVMGTVVVLMRQPDRLTERRQVQAAPALPRNLAITKGQRALPAPAKVLEGVVLEEPAIGWENVPAAVRRAAR